MDSTALKPAASTGNTHQRLLDAAARVFAQSGLEGATTRKIAREAGVNEVTLFRHFLTKEKLLAEVIRRTFDQQDAALAAPGQPPPAVPAARRSRRQANTAPQPPNLRGRLLQFARRYEEVSRANMPLVRTLIGGIHRHGEYEMHVKRSIFAPLKAELLATMQAAHRAGELRPGIDPIIAADALGGMIFMDALRRSSPMAPDYPADQYQAACVELFVRGIEA